jgi:hypothetical protein
MLVVASLIGLAAVLGVVALGKTLGLGAASSNAQNAVIAKRTRQLDRFEAALHKQLAASKAARPAADAVPTTPPAPRAQRVVYVRPKPIVVHTHRAGGELEHEGSSESEGEWDD